MEVDPREDAERGRGLGVDSGDEGRGAVDPGGAGWGGGEGRDEGVDQVEVEDGIVGAEGEEGGGVDGGWDGSAVAWGWGGGGLGEAEGWEEEDKGGYAWE